MLENRADSLAPSNFSNEPCRFVEPGWMEFLLRFSWMTKKQRIAKTACD